MSVDFADAMNAVANVVLAAQIWRRTELADPDVHEEAEMRLRAALNRLNEIDEARGVPSLATGSAGHAWHSDDGTMVCTRCGVMQDQAVRACPGPVADDQPTTRSSGVGTWGLSGHTKVLPRAADDAAAEPRWRRFNRTTGVMRGGNTHPDRCVCQGDDETPHKHYDREPHSCARCGHKNCAGYRAWDEDASDVVADKPVVDLGRRNAAALNLQRAMTLFRSPDVVGGGTELVSTEYRMVAEYVLAGADAYDAERKASGSAPAAETDALLDESQRNLANALVEVGRLRGAIEQALEMVRQNWPWGASETAVQSSDVLVQRVAQFLEAAVSRTTDDCPCPCGDHHEHSSGYVLRGEACHWCGGSSPSREQDT